MEIYIVQVGDNINTIANRFGVPVDRLAYDNGLEFPYRLILGQAIIIAFPKQTHTVQEGDTLQSIADMYQVSYFQVLRNNSFLADREYLYPGETLVISYNTVGSITTNGYIFAFISQATLIKILPNLTYLSIFNYRTTESGEVLQYREDQQIIQSALEYGVVPLLMLSTLTASGEPNIETSFNILLNEEFQDRNINQFVEIAKSKGYYGVNLVFNYLSQSSQTLYINFVRKISERLQQEGLLFFITINYSLQSSDGIAMLGGIDYGTLSSYVDGMIFLKVVWGTNYDPPAPISNINQMRVLVNDITKTSPPEKITVGSPILGYDWPLPFIPDRTSATSMTVNSVYELAYDNNAVIQFDEISLTPFFYYSQIIGIPVDHIVWFIDVRTINALNDVVKDYSLYGSGIWNLMFYYPQLWTSINSEFEIIKLIN
ncbi:MAG: hypothetical protein K0R46_40 [Herbinix sp.]|nr:hypothetical protein [Herbinix sp.]